AIACVALMTGSATAATVNMSANDTVALQANTKYTSTTTVTSPDPFTHDFTFEAAGAGGLSGDLSANITVASEFSLLTLQWINAGTSEVLETFSPTTSVTSVALGIVVGTDYILRLAGQINPGAAGTYSFALTTTPIPPALLLFGSA